MPPLPKLSGREAVRVFERLGWTVARQKGSHITLAKDNNIATLSVPDHKELAKGTLRSLIRAFGVTISEFNEKISR
ncbi:putative periplasmic or secreted lipoprotein [Thioflavicoccus mobilis 8321]|uniref:Putative periplasmic or secreted lipoprotein n=1 Tax=Thioflavicoccus mobilis 8321 TaxID=765912 RepID=L0GZB2_9GAMM|nr:type II toxin-antitoxin system HicA family toxin [Thioflavicoccus mobilis]AGA91301.1 putative periplasmic or secreted lipoprotein [Thioflavicoccus mobilis 8321]